jgi:hypothetical protein
VTPEIARPVSLRVLEIVLARLRGITKSNGFNTDAGNYVMHADAAMDRLSDHCVGISVFEGEESPRGTTGKGGSDRLEISLNIEVQLHALANRAETGKLISLGKADIKRALFRGSEQVDGFGRKRHLGPDRLADADGDIGGTLEYGGAQPFVREPGMQSEAVVITAIANYIERMGDPHESLGTG